MKLTKDLPPLTQIKPKKKACKPPNLVLPSSDFSADRSSISSSQPTCLDPTADEFKISDFATSLPKADATLSSFLDSLSLSVTPPPQLSSGQVLPPFPYSPAPAYLQSLPCTPTPASNSVTATVEKPGYISFKLNFGVVVVSQLIAIAFRAGIICSFHLRIYRPIRPSEWSTKPRARACLFPPVQTT